MRRHCHPAAGALIATAFLLAAPPAAAANLMAYVKDEAGKPVADAVVYAAPRRDAPVSRAHDSRDGGGRVAPGAKTEDAQERPLRGGTPPRERVVMDQRDREFMPYVLPVQVGTPVYFPNSDNIRHHVYSFSPAKKFELPLYKGTPTAPVVFDKPGAVALGCNIHDWMIGYVYVLETPYFGKTAGRGEARLTNLPAGEYELRVWHPRLKEAVDKTLRPVTLSASGETRIEFSIGLNPEQRKKRPSSYESDNTGYSY